MIEPWAFLGLGVITEDSEFLALLGRGLSEPEAVSAHLSMRAEDLEY